MKNLPSNDRKSTVVSINKKYDKSGCNNCRGISTYELISSILLSRLTPYNRTVYQLFIDFKKAYCSFKKDALCRILREFSTSMKLVKRSKTHV
jgi:hypothetical protein